MALNGSVVMGNFIGPREEDPKLLSVLFAAAKGEGALYDASPMSQVFFPVYDAFPEVEDRKTVGVMVAWIHWLSYFENLFPSSLEGIHVVLGNRCGDSNRREYYTFRIDGSNVFPMGEGDLHEDAFAYEGMQASTTTIEYIPDGTPKGLPFDTSNCELRISVYPSAKFHSAYITSQPTIMVLCVLIVFVVGLTLFCIYDL